MAEPPLGLLYWLYRLASREQLADHSLPGEGGGEPERILVVRLDNIGDVLLSEPAIRALGECFPEASIDVVTGVGGRAILSGHPTIRSFLAYDAPWHAAWRGQPVRWREELPNLLAAVRELRRRRFDLAVELRGDFRDIAFMAASGARVKVGSSWRGGHRLLDHDAPADLGGHRIALALSIVAALGAATSDPVPRIHLRPEHRARAASLFPEGDSLIAFHLGAGFACNRMPTGKLAVVAQALLAGERSYGRRLVLIGGGEERGLANDFAKQLSFQPLDLVGRLSLLETAAVLERCQLFIGGDSAPMHMASALGVPTVTFFGAEVSTNYGPVGAPARVLEADLPCRPCDHIHCVHDEYLCLTSIANEEIIAAAEELLTESGVGAAAVVRQVGGG